MEAPLQQRIVGAIVLVTLGVIFIPALLDGSGYKARQAKDIVVQEKPRFPPQSKKKLDPIPTPLDEKRAVKTEQAKKQAAIENVAKKTPVKKQIKKNIENTSSSDSKSKTMAKVKSVAKAEPKIIDRNDKAKNGSANVEKKEVIQNKLDTAKAAKAAETKTSKKKRIKSFAIQVGTFDSKENAEKIRNELRKRGYTTYIQKSESKTNPSYRVRIGPELDFDALERRLKKLKKSRRYDGYIVNHP